MDFTAADLLSAWIYQPKPAHFYLPGYPVLLHSTAARGFEKRQKQNSARGLLYQKIQASFWRCLCDNFSKSDAKCIDICNPMSTSYEREIEDGDQMADYDGDYREPYATRLYLMLEPFAEAKLVRFKKMKAKKENKDSGSEICVGGRK
jgi:hypothetical protein